MSDSTNPRPVLLPQGWPEEDSEREALNRVLLAAGADIERLLDAPSNSPDAFVRHAQRLPFLRDSRECPMVVFAPRSDDVGFLLKYRTTLLTAVDSLGDATWLIYLSATVRVTFHRLAVEYGNVTDVRGGLFTWGVTPGILGLVSRDTWVVGLSTRLEELLTPCLDSGVVSLDELRFPRIASTVPAPPSAPERFNDVTFAPVARNAANPKRQGASPFERAVDSYRNPSTMPPNPRLRKG